MTAITRCSSHTFTLPPTDQIPPPPHCLSAFFHCLIPNVLGSELVKSLALPSCREYPVSHYWDSDPVSNPDSLHCLAVPIAYQRYEDTVAAYRALKESYRKITLHFNTADGNEIEGTFYENRVHVNEAIPTILYFCGNGEPQSLSTHIATLLELAQREGKAINLIGVNYRGCFSDENTPNDALQLVRDCKAIYHKVIRELHINPRDVVLYGHSLGGGVAQGVRFLLGDTFEGKMVHDRSFSRITEVARAFSFNILTNIQTASYDEILEFFSFLIGSCLAHPLSWLLIGCRAVLSLFDSCGLPLTEGLKALIAHFVTCYIKLFRWELDSTQGWESNDRVMVIEHEQDAIIPPVAQLSRHVALTAEKHLTIKRRSGILESNDHCSSLYCHETERGQNAAEEVLNFILS